MFSACDPQQETEDKQGGKFELLGDGQRSPDHEVSCLARVSSIRTNRLPWNEQDGEEDQEQDHHEQHRVHWPSSRPLRYFRISNAVRSKKILPVCSNFRISTEARACLPSDCLQTSIRA